MVNKVIIQGRLVKDIELKKTQSDVAYTEFTIAWSEKIKEIENKCFLRVKAWRHTAEFLSKYFSKGKELVIEGQMRTDEWTENGENKSRTICYADKVHFCGPNQDNSNNNSNNEPTPSSDDGFMQVDEDSEDGLPINF